MKTKKPIRLPIFVKGSATVYFLSILLIVSSITSCLCSRAVAYQKRLKEMDAFLLMNQTEVLIINRIKQNYRQYKEKSEILIYKGCIVTIVTDGLRATIEIRYKEYCRSRVLIYDDCEEVVADYY